ncbi:MAG: hypothetical protein ACOC0N_09025 [Chroococcales cyanobacterium]
MTKTISFSIDHKGEPGAGILSYSDSVQITLESGDPGGEEGEFEAHMRDALESWFDGADVIEEEED